MGNERAAREAASELLDAVSPLLVRRFRDQLYAHLQPSSPVPVRDGTYPLLMALAQQPGTASQVAARVGVDRTVVTRQATLVEQAGLVARDIDARDRRNTVLTLTGAGRQVVEAMHEASVDVLESVVGEDISVADLRTATRVLLALRDAAESGIE